MRIVVTVRHFRNVSIRCTGCVGSSVVRWRARWSALRQEASVASDRTISDAAVQGVSGRPPRQLALRSGRDLASHM